MAPPSGRGQSKFEKYANGQTNGHAQGSLDVGEEDKTYQRRVEAVKIDWTDPKAVASFILCSRWFDPFIGFLIFLNACSIGADQSLSLDGHDTTFFQVLESVFLCVYLIELMLRFYVIGITCVLDNWVKFDILLVLLGVLTSWIIEPSMEDSPGALNLLMVLRTARMLRLAKLARQLAQVREFWMLIRGFLNSATLMVYTLVLLFFVLYVLSSLAIEIITKHHLAVGENPDPEFQKHVEEYFRSLPVTMCTLVRFVCMDQMSMVYKPLVDKDASLMFYFIVTIIVVGIIIMNLIASVVFNSTIEKNTEEYEASKRNQEDEWSALIKDLKDMFLRLDADGSGQLSLEEVMNIAPKDRNALGQALGVSTPMEVFQALDVDNSGTVSINEFFDGVWDIALAKAPVDLKRIEKQVEGIQWRVKENFGLTHEMSVAIQTLIQALAEDPFFGPRKSLVVPDKTKGKKEIAPPRTPEELIPDWADNICHKLKILSEDLLDEVSKADIRRSSIVDDGGYDIETHEGTHPSVSVASSAASSGVGTGILQARPKSPKPKSDRNKDRKVTMGRKAIIDFSTSRRPGSDSPLGSRSPPPTAPRLGRKSMAASMGISV